MCYEHEPHHVFSKLVKMFNKVSLFRNNPLYCMTRRASKVKALHQMSSMLPTPTTERLQQKVETDWTPSTAGHHSLQDDVSIFTPFHVDQALSRVNESLGKCSGEGRTSPVTSLMETKIAKVNPEEQTYFV